MTLPELTILMGPPTRAAYAINDQVRIHRWALATHGINAAPLRLAGPAARALAMDEDTSETRLAAYEDRFKPDTYALWSAINLFGPARVAYRGGELLPGAAPVFLGLSRLPARPRLVITIEPLHRFFAGLGSGALSGRISKTSWDVLYELSWAELISDMRAILPEHEICVISPDAALCRAEGMAETLFGEGAGLIDVDAFRNAYLSSEGQAALAAMKPEQVSEDILRELGHRLGNAPEPADLEARFGIDKLTATLLDKRFDEDMVAIGKIPGVAIW